MIKNIIFDLSEVIISGYLNVEKLIESKKSISQESFLKRKEETLEIFLDTMRGKYSEEDYLRLLLKDTDWQLTVEELKSLIRENIGIPVEGMFELINKLKRNYNLILVSDHIKEWVEFIEQNDAVLDLFENRFFSCGIGKLKSDEGLFDFILEKMNITANETLFVDDNKLNVDTAIEHGLKGIIFKDCEQLKRELLKYNVE